MNKGSRRYIGKVKRDLGYNVLPKSFNLKDAEDSGLFSSRQLHRLYGGRDGTIIPLIERKICRGPADWVWIKVGILVKDLVQRKKKTNKIKQAEKELKQLEQYASVKRWIELNDSLKRMK